MSIASDDFGLDEILEDDDATYPNADKKGKFDKQNERSIINIKECLSPKSYVVMKKQSSAEPIKRIPTDANIKTPKKIFTLLSDMEKFR